MDTRAKGRQGEEIARKYLEQRSYEIVVSNYYARGGEIDIIAWDKTKKELVFVEVKARKNNFFGYPEAAVTEQKMQRIFGVAQRYVAKVNYRGNFRFDCLSIELD